MKEKMSISIDEKAVELVEKLVDGIRFRSKSHVLEYSLNKFLNEEILKND